MFFLRRKRLNRELDEEILAHLAIERQERIDRGETPAQAAQSARRDLGNELLIKEVTREMWGWSALERVWRDAIYALRQMKRSPGFASIAVLSLALGIGANSAIFSLLNSLLFKALPVPAPEELFDLHIDSRVPVPQRFSYPMFLRLRDTHSGALGMAAMIRPNRAQTSLETGARAEMVPYQMVSGEYFSLLGLSPALGRLLSPADNQIAGGDPVAVISYGYWQRAFAGSADVLGRMIRLNGVQFTIVGVAPEHFRGVWIESPADIWIPLMMQANIHYVEHYSSQGRADTQPWVTQEDVEWLDVVARVRPGTAPVVRSTLAARYQNSMQDLAGGFPPEMRRYFQDRSLSLDPLAHGFSNVRGRATSPLIAMMVMVGLVLLIACANTANLLMARAESRRREMAVRLSIGAGRARLIQQLLTESFLLVFIAAALGMWIAQFASEKLVRMALGVVGPTPFSTGVDGHVLAFTIALSLVTGLLFGLAPAFRATRMELGSEVKLRHGRVRVSGAKLLVAAQVALSLIVVIGAAMFARSLRNLAHVRLGFDREHVLSVSISPRVAGYGEPQLPALYRRLVERAESIPGVRSAVVSMCGLEVECRSIDGNIKITGYQPAPGEDTRLQYSMIGPGYFSTVGMRLLSGRDFTPADSGKQVAIVNEALVRRYLAGRNPLGQRFGDKLETEIIGVVRDARVNRVREEPFPMAYFPLRGNAVYAGSLEVRAAGDPKSIAADVRQAVSEVAPDLPVARITPLALQVDRSLNAERMGSVVTAAFGFLALGLACFGLYGVMSYAVSRRTSEIGVRMALGARPKNVLWGVLREALWLIGLGLVIGVPIVIASSRSVAALLYGVQPNDPATLAATVAILTGVAVFAALWPAWRASRVSPMAALRYE